MKKVIKILLIGLFIFTVTQNAYSTPLTYEMRPCYTVVSDPWTVPPLVLPGGDLDGVGAIFVSRDDGSFLLSGALLPTGRHLITAAHGFTDNNGLFNTNDASIIFQGEFGPTVINALNYYAITANNGWHHFCYAPKIE